MTDALSLQDVSLSLNGNAGVVDILQGISLTVTKGETLGLVGPSGSGKSSLLMLMGGLESATSGSITALGTDITRLGEDDLARFRRDNMGVVFQSFHLIPTMTALENVATPLELAGARDAYARAEAELAVDGTGTTAALAAGVGANLELRLCVCLVNQCFFGHGSAHLLFWPP